MIDGNLIPIVLFHLYHLRDQGGGRARFRHKMIGAGGSEELIRSMLQGEEVRRRHASLRWGIILVALAGGFALIQQSDWHELTPGMIAVLAGATGLGNLIYFAIARKLT